MAVYYNENNPEAVAWLRELVRRGLIADGIVDDRSIEDVLPEEIKHFEQCHFFAGIGVWSYALRQAGWPDDRRVWTGSCPCQPFSSAGKGAGFADERHLWPAFHWLISQCQPGVVFGEQVAGKAGEAWLDLVSTDLEMEGYACGASVTAACGFGAPHQRKRLYWVADAEGDHDRRKRRASREGGQGCACGDGVTGSGTTDKRGPTNGFWRDADWLGCRDGKWRPVEPGTFPLADGAPARVGRLRGYGNAIVAQQAQAFIESYMEVAS